MDWLTQTTANISEQHWGSIAIRLVVAFALGCMIQTIYRLTHRPSDKPESSFLTTLVLLTVIIAMSTQVIGDHIARAFSLVGALSIVRFRTAVQDTRDIAFVIFAVVAGMAAGIGNYPVAIVGVILTGFAAWFMRPQASEGFLPNPRSSLKISLGFGRESSALHRVFDKYLAAHYLRSTVANPVADAYELTYQVSFQNDRSTAEFLEEIRKLDGVRQIKLSSINR